MPLGEVRLRKDLALGTKIMEVASNKWPSTTTVIVLLIYVTNRHSHVGIVKPEFFNIDAENVPARKRILNSSDPFGIGKTLLAGILNLDNAHWMSFLFYTKSGKCILYDPYRKNRNLRAKPLRLAVKSCLAYYEGELEGEIEYIPYERYGCFDQDDGSSCAVYCAAFLELVLNKVDAKDATLPSCVYRARYLTLLSVVMREAEDFVSHISI